MGLYRGTEEVKAEAEGTGVCSVNSNKLEPLEPQISIAVVYTIRQRLSQYYIMIMVATIYYLACKVNHPRKNCLPSDCCFLEYLLTANS